MSAISARDNPRFKRVRRLAASAPVRREARRTLLEGAHLCAAYLNRIGAPALCVVAESGAANPEIAALTASVSARDRLVVTDALFRSISQLEQGVGILFEIDVPQRSTPQGLAGPAMLLDRLQDPGNLGSMLRSAAAAGVRAIYCSHGTVDAWSPKVMRAGMGAHFELTISEDCALVELVRNARIPVLVTSSHAAASLYDADLSGPVAWVFGNEGRGVSPSILEWATELAIPQPGGMESLNVAAAAAICLFEGVRQRRYDSALATLSR